MMNRWASFWVCAIAGLLLVVCGWLVPAHLRAVDIAVVQRAGRKGPGLIEQGLGLVNMQKLGAAQMLLLAAQEEGVPGREKLGAAAMNLAREHPNLTVLGSAEPWMERLAGARGLKSGPVPFTEFVVRLENRDKVMDLLNASRRPALHELMRFRTLTNTTIFSPSQSASGQALDAALSVCGLLLEGGHLKGGLRESILALASEANRGGNPQRLEQVLLDLMSLGQRFNWGQLVEFVGQVEDAEALRLLAIAVRKAEGKVPLLFSAVNLSGTPAQVARYLMNYSESGLKDLGWSLRFGAGAVTEVLQRDQRLYSSGLRQQVAGLGPFSAFFDLAVDYCWLMPGFALAMKWFFYLAGGFLIAMAMHFARPAVSVLERPLQVRGFHLARESLFALGFLVVVLFLSEPFLSQESQKVEFPFRLRLPMVGSVVASGITGAHPSIMNQLSLLTLLLFFVLQALIYMSCLFKLAEIRRQRLPPRIKLKLLENEDHLFDAGLYLGFAGTIISLILVSVGVIKPSLMAAYSSTSFGIIFVSVFKIFHLRPERRKLLLEAEAVYPEPTPAPPVHSLAAPL